MTARMLISGNRFSSLCGLLLLLLVPLSPAMVYTITDLGTLGGASQAYGLNTFGQVVGYSCIDSNCVNLHAFLWARSRGMQDLGTLPGGGSHSYAAGVNELGQVVGSSDFAQPFIGNTHAFLWTMSTGMQDLGTLGCPNITGANGINLFGQIVGTSTIAPCPGGGQYRAFLWTENGGMQDLGTLPGGSFSFGNALNIFSQAVGYSDCSTCSGYHAFLWTMAGGMQDLGTLPGGTYSAATGLNNFGSIVGTSDSAMSGAWVHAFAWTSQGGMHDLGTLPGGIWSGANAVNDFGQIVGSADSESSLTHVFFRARNGGVFSGGSHAFIWTQRYGMQDLNDLVRPHSGWVLIDARAINASGQIAGWGTIDGQTHAFLLTPKGHAE